MKTRDILNVKIELIDPFSVSDEDSHAFAISNSGVPTANENTSYVGIYVGVIVALLLLTAVGASFFFIQR